MLSSILLALAPFACFSPDSLASQQSRPPATASADYTIHEWGTFTTVSDDEGQPMPWRPLLSRSDLPPFVYEIQEQSKSRTVGLVRMETPVIYFYADRPLTVSVSVAFPQGQFTEWYPNAEVNVWGPHVLSWKDVQVGASGSPPVSEVKSHYLPAREVDSALLGVGTERERFLFYRGVASFEPARSFRLDGERVVSDSPGTYLVFRNEGGRTGFTLVRGQSSVTLPTTDGGDVREALYELLTGAGLYADEARAMIASWEGDWFEPGLRVFWLYDGAETDEVLPLTLSPAPRERTRVLVGRTELIPPAFRQQALAMARQQTDRESLRQALEARFGRFAQPVARLAAESGQPGSEALRSMLIIDIDPTATRVVD